METEQIILEASVPPTLQSTNDLNNQPSTSRGPTRAATSLGGKQIEIVNTILHAVNDPHVEKCFLIDGPGGTGKTFIYKTLYYMLSGRC